MGAVTAQTAGRKVEAGPQVDVPRLQSSHRPRHGNLTMARPEAAGRLQRADQDRDGGTQPRRAARGLGQPMPSQQVSPTSSYMNSESLESTVRLEANELQRHWDESQNLGPWHLSLRIGDGSAGLIRAERKSATELKVVLDQKAEHIQYIQVRRLADDAGHLIIECPACCRWRRQVYMSPPGFGSHAEGFRFVCKDCAIPRSSFPRRSNQPKSRRRAARSGFRVGRRPNSRRPSR